MAKVTVGSGSMTDLQKIQFARQIVLDMTGNAFFTTPAPALTALTAAASALEDAYNTAQTQRQLSKSMTTDQAQKSAALDLLLLNESNYVQSITDGDPMKIETSGFGVKAPPTPIGDLPAPVISAITPSQNAGTVDMKWSKITGAKSYSIQRAIDSTTPLNYEAIAVATKTKATVNSMTSGSKYWFRVAAVGTAGQGDWSDAISKIAP